MRYLSFDAEKALAGSVDEFLPACGAVGLGRLASPQQGKEMLEKWFAKEDKDIRWIMKENLRKDRLARMDPEWTKQWKLKLGMS